MNTVNQAPETISSIQGIISKIRDESVDAELIIEDTRRLISKIDGTTGGFCDLQEGFLKERILMITTDKSYLGALLIWVCIIEHMKLLPNGWVEEIPMALRPNADSCEDCTAEVDVYRPVIRNPLKSALELIVTGNEILDWHLVYV